jgi:hypothetical protein
LKQFVETGALVGVLATTTGAFVGLDEGFTTGAFVGAGLGGDTLVELHEPNKVVSL